MASTESPDTDTFFTPTPRLRAQLEQLQTTLSLPMNKTTFLLKPLGSALRQNATQKKRITTIQQHFHKQLLESLTTSPVDRAVLLSQSAPQPTSCNPAEKHTRHNGTKVSIEQTIQINKDDGIHLQAHRGGTSLNGIGSGLTKFFSDPLHPTGCRQIHHTRDFFSTYCTLCTHHIVAQGVAACV